MAASTITMVLSNGQIVSIWDATSAAVGSEKRVNLNGIAAIDSPYGFRVMSRACVVDYIVLASTDGEFEVIANGQRTGIKFPVNDGLTNAATKRVFPRYCFSPGITYTFWQTRVRSA